MKVFKKLSVLGASALLLASCSITQPLAVTDNSLGDKVGKSKTLCLFTAPASTSGSGYIISSGICTNGKYGIVDAVENGGIKTVGAVDIKVTDFILWKTYELIVAGE